MVSLGEGFCALQKNQFTVSNIFVETLENFWICRCSKASIASLCQIKRISKVFCLCGHTVSSDSKLSQRVLFYDMFFPNVDTTLILSNSDP